MTKNVFNLSANAFKNLAEKRKAEAEAEAEAAAAAANYPLTMSSGVSLGTIVLIGFGGALLLHFIRGK